MEELEIVPQYQISGMRMFVNTVEYRSPHFHPEWELLWVLDAPLHITSAQKKYEIQPGELILFPPNWPHEFHEMERPCTFLCLQVSSRAFPTTAHMHTDEIRLADCMPKEEIRWLRQAMLDTARMCFTEESHFELFCMGQCGLILHRLLQFVPCHNMTPEEQASTEQRNARLTRLMQFVDENFTHKIRLADFAKAEGCTLSFLSRFVREAMNQTFQLRAVQLRPEAGGPDGKALGQHLLRIGFFRLPLFFPQLPDGLWYDTGRIPPPIPVCSRRAADAGTKSPLPGKNLQPGKESGNSGKSPTAGRNVCVSLKYGAAAKRQPPVFSPQNLLVIR